MIARFLARQLPSLPKLLGPALGAALLALAVPALAQTPTIYEEAGQIIRGSRNVATLGPDLFGDKVSLYTGSLEFVQTDIDISGNNALPVRVGRRLTTGSTRIAGGAFGDWDLDIPHLKGVFSKIDGWNVGANQLPADKYKRCSRFDGPAPAWTQTRQVLVPTDEFWFGNQIYVPGSGEEELLLRRPGDAYKPEGPVDYPVVTKSGWALRCLDSLPNGAVGEGFVALSPDGTQYRFDHLVSRPYPPYRTVIQGHTDFSTAGTPRAGLTPTVAMNQLLARVEVWLLPTKVTDRFGNTVTYTFSPTKPWQLLGIDASDGRRIEFEYHATIDRVVSIKARSSSERSHEWRYEYSAVSPLARLTRIVQPDGSAWSFAGDNLQANPAYLLSPAGCLDTGTLDTTPFTYSLTHPSGATGAFTLVQVLHGRSHVAPTCPTDSGFFTNRHPVHYATRALHSKTLTGPGLPAAAADRLTWRYAWGAANGSVSPCNGCADSATMTVTDPEGNVTRYTHGIRWNQTEGLLQRVEEGLTKSANDQIQGPALRVTDHAYRMSPDGKYPEVAGISITGRGDGYMASRNLPRNALTHSQQSATFAWTADDYDERARPTAVSKTGPSGTRSEATVYLDKKTLWVLGQIESITRDGKVEEWHDYDAKAQRKESRSFGRLLAKYEYHDDGTLKAVLDPAERRTLYDDYHRGLPRKITHRDGAIETITVDDLGHVGTYTNAVGTTTGYQYDAMGRLSRIVYPTGDEVPYHDTVINFRPVAAAEYGLDPGHWVQTVTTGNAVNDNYFDALWRPRLTVTRDSTRATSTSRAQRFDYDSDGRKVFESFAQRSIGAITASIPGISTTHDALGRVTRVDQSTDTVAATTTTRYLDGFLREVTNPRGHVTRYQFQAFDRPSEDAIARILAPEGVTVSITRDTFGKPKQITRSGGGLSATRSYSYDNHERLCKTVEPETNATVQQYDLSGNVAWRASGLNLPIDRCDPDAVPAARKISHGYDARDRLTSTTYGDGSPGITRSYYGDGKPWQVLTPQAHWTYWYNHRRLLVTERMRFASTDHDFGHLIDAHGNVRAHVYPGSQEVTYSPNALGEPTAVGLGGQTTAFARDVLHHPNGAVDAYTLANGVAHSMTPDVQGRPKQWKDGSFLADRYTYDANGNVTAITDETSNGTTARSTSRILGYDALDRLTTASGRWGTGIYGYDALENMIRSTVGPRSLTHKINPTTNRLDRLSGSPNLDLQVLYDANGNVVKRGNQGFSFDIGNRLTSALGRASYSYDGHGRRVWAYANGAGRMQMYTQDGKLRYGSHPSQGQTRHIYLGGKLIAEVNSLTGTSFVHTDALGSPVARTSGLDGTVFISQTQYEPYGGTAAGVVPTGIGFTGHVNDADTGLVYMQQRYYDPVAGRFLSVDPIVTNTNAGDHFNRYAYVDNNPFKSVDPDGLSGVDANRPNEQGPGEAGGDISDLAPNAAPQIEAALMHTGSGIGLTGVMAGTAKSGGVATLRISATSSSSIGYHATLPEAAKSILADGFRLGTKPGRLGSGGVYVNNTTQGAAAEFLHHNPGVIPRVLEVRYSSAVNASAAVPPRTYVSSHPLNVDTISAPSVRAPGTINTNILNGTAVPVRILP